jgi:hypothetical protein
VLDDDEQWRQHLQVISCGLIFHSFFECVHVYVH